MVADLTGSYKFKFVHQVGAKLHPFVMMLRVLFAIRSRVVILIRNKNNKQDKYTPNYVARQYVLRTGIQF